MKKQKNEKLKKMADKQEEEANKEGQKEEENAEKEEAIAPDYEPQIKEDHSENSFHMNMAYIEDKEEQTAEAADSLRSSLDLITTKLYYNCWSSKTPSLLNDHSLVSIPEMYFKEMGRPQVLIQCSLCPRVTEFFTTGGEEPKQWSIGVEEVAPNATQPTLPLPWRSPLPTTILPSTSEPASNQCPLPEPHSTK